MSKKLKNYTDPMELMDKFSADSFRFLMLMSPLTNGENFALADKDVGDVARKLGMIWNMYDFFTMYAEVDGWEFDGELVDPLDSLSNPLDIWVVSRLHELVATVEERTEAYDLQGALRPILPFVDDASNWYVRRSRRRFWKGEDDADKADAYKTLHYVLTSLAYVLAPFAPFMAEELHYNMTGDTTSIHLKDWRPASRVNLKVMKAMDQVRDYVNQGLSLRAKAGVKVRQPLAAVRVPELGEAFDFVSILQDELNVKHVERGKAVELDLVLTPELKREGMVRELIRHIQSARKAAGLHIDDRILVAIYTDDTELQMALDEHESTIAGEVLASKLERTSKDYAHSQEATIDGVKAMVSLQRAR